jgi:hypothetical protein
MKDNDERYIRKHVEESVSGIECLRKPTNNLRIAYLWGTKYLIVRFSVRSSNDAVSAVEVIW